MYKRILSFSLAITLLLCGICGRIGYIIFSKNYVVSGGKNSYSLNIDKKQPTLYYRTGIAATNNARKYVAVIKPTPRSVSELNKLFTEKEQKEIIEQLKSGKPVLVDIDDFPSASLKSIKIYKRYSSENELHQIIAKQSNGLLNHTGEEIGKSTAMFGIDANGRILDGDEGTLEQINYDSKEGYRLSVDKRIQDITVDASSKMKSGCVIVMNTEDSSILACVNKPFDNYLIKAFSQYSVGSVFKIVVAACALENDVNVKYNCTGKIKVGDTEFSCQNNHIHSNQTLKQALANSCNCYFVNLANTLGSDKLLETCDKLGFNDYTALFDGWNIVNSYLPTKSDLLSKGELSLFGFGQGKLTASPLQIASVLCTISNDGYYSQPKLVLSNVNNQNVQTDTVYPSKEKVLKTNTCKKLIEYMRYVVTDGTARIVMYDDKKSAGKTATAQTGQYYNGVEKLNTWFVGLYPYDKPKYAIVIMTEDGKSGAGDCCPIFSTIVEQLGKM